MNSKKLTLEQKAQLLEQADDYLISCCDHMFSSQDSSDFHEGVAKGVLLAFEAFNSNANIPPAVAHSLVAIIARAIRQANKINT